MGLFIPVKSCTLCQNPVSTYWIVYVDLSWREKAAKKKTLVGNTRQADEKKNPHEHHVWACVCEHQALAIDTNACCPSFLLFIAEQLLTLTHTRFEKRSSSEKKKISEGEREQKKNTVLKGALLRDDFFSGPQSGRKKKWAWERYEITQHLSPYCSRLQSSRGGYTWYVDLHNCITLSPELHAKLKRRKTEKNTACQDTCVVLSDLIIVTIT